MEANDDNQQRQRKTLKNYFHHIKHRVISHIEGPIERNHHKPSSKKHPPLWCLASAYPIPITEVPILSKTNHSPKYPQFPPLFPLFSILSHFDFLMSEDSSDLPVGFIVSDNDGDESVGLDDDVGLSFRATDL